MATVPPKDGVSRRTFLTGTIAGGSAAVGAGLAGLGPAAAQTGNAPAASDGLAAVTLVVNGREHRLRVDPRTTVLDALRETLGLTGTKVGCNHGQCGACTVLMDGARVNSCLTLAVVADGRSVTTIEGLAGADGALHPMQAAFIEHDAFQCGYCTPGQILSAVGCVNEGHAGSADEIREYMSGNLCRCGAYNGIVEAVTDARQKMEA